VQRYDGRVIVWHVDLYRLERASELPELGLDDLFGDPGCVVIVEWADRFDVMPADHLRVELAHVATGRTLTATGTGPRGAALARLLGSIP
ncbi:MAG TPA: tRNA (adenosine(37)-N6)-threonylcarbamoyltransferase complex ATPase subunit type 1 TsaE, partial [Kofleriaceae bacterium]|nr:tRNA (adenosine(37)-N6)-threonylcarbamoyltransferase complex ATPase subunit type 1 TsaE [Kofleriaceae bacterium]